VKGERASRVVVVFAGQGLAPSRAHLEALLADESGARQLELASRFAGLGGAKEFLAEGGRALDRTAVLQPLVVASSLVAFESLAELLVDVETTLVGHSLGEVSAVAACGALAHDAAIELAAVRGAAMEAASLAAPGGLYAMRREDADRARREVDRLFVALDNAPDEVVLGGDADALAGLTRRFPGARLRVPGAFHGPSMAPATVAMRAACQALEIASPTRLMITALDCEPVADAALVRDVLTLGPSRPMRFREAFGVAARDALMALVCGPSRAIRAIVRQLAPALRVLGCETERERDDARAALREVS